MQRPEHINPGEEVRYQLTIIDSAIKLIILGEKLDEGLVRLAERMKIEDGWEVLFHDEQSDNTGSFSRKDGKRIDLYRLNKEGLRISNIHLIASLIHEYIFGELADESSKSDNPEKYMLDHYREFAEIDAGVANYLDIPGQGSSSINRVKAHRRQLPYRQLPPEEIVRLLAK